MVRRIVRIDQHLVLFAEIRALDVRIGQHLGRIEFLDREGNVLEQRSQTVSLDVAADDRDTVVFLSELKR